MERVEWYSTMRILLEQRSDQGRCPTQHGAGGRQVDLNFGARMLDGIALDEGPATRALASCRD